MCNIKIYPCVVKRTDVNHVDLIALSFTWHIIPLNLFLSSVPLHIFFVTADYAVKGFVRHAEKVRAVGSIFQCREGDISLLPPHTYTIHINLMSVVVEIKMKV